VVRFEVVVISLKINQLRPGMVLSEPVHNQSGLLLLEKDASLTKKRIWMLKTWGIEKVSVKGKSKADGTKTRVATETESIETIEKELKAKFADVIDDPVMQEILKAAARQLQKSLSDQDAEDKLS
jgi:DNA-binding NtrC family response regulator